jgi:hypothetical protein
MAITRKGQTGWILESPGALQTDRFGLATATARWRRMDTATNANPGTPVVFTNTHPLWSYLSCDKYTISQADNGWNCEASYYGFTGSPDPIYELDMRAAEEPIESHPDFASFAFPEGTNGSKFGSDQMFEGFKPEYDGTVITNPDWVGVRAYLAPGAVWRKTYLSASRPSSLSGIGAIATPDGSPPTVGGAYNWLYTGLTYEQRGAIYTVRQEWLLSGRRGWNASIYT